MASANIPTKSEEIYGEKWDRCLSETCVKVGRPWPVIFGSGIGLGMGYANCQHDFVHPDIVHGRIMRVIKSE